jgi:hypothetical protein
MEKLSCLPVYWLPSRSCHLPIGHDDVITSPFLGNALVTTEILKAPHRLCLCFQAFHITAEITSEITANVLLYRPWIQMASYFSDSFHRCLHLSMIFIFNK